MNHNCCKWAKGHLTKNAKEASREKLTEVKDQTSQLPHDKEELGVLSDKEDSHVKQTVESKAMPSPKLLIKDHKEGNFPAGLAVSETNFTSAFPKIDCLGIKRITDDNKADHMSKTTIQASENQGTTCNNSTTTSMDGEDFCPLATLKMVRTAVCHFSKDLPEEDQITIEHCLDLIKFRMQSTLLAFVDKCHECDGDREPEEKGLTIGGHESAWLPDLAGAHIPDSTKSHFRKTKCCGPHRDDGTEAFNNKLSCNDMLKWRTKFQNSANRLTGGNCPQFTCTMWTSQEERCQQKRMTPTCLSKQGISFHAWTLNLSGQPTETHNSECISNQTNN